MKPTSRYATLRAFGVGTVAGCIGGAVLGLALVHLGAAAFYGLCCAVGAGAWGLAELLDRRALRIAADGKTHLGCMKGGDGKG